MSSICIAFLYIDVPENLHPSKKQMSCDSMQSLFSVLLCLYTILLLCHQAHAACDRSEYWTPYSNQCRQNWGCAKCPSDAVQFCTFSPPPLGCPSDAEQVCAKNNQPSSCRDELCLCKKDYYAAYMNFKCKDFVGDGYISPIMEDEFICFLCMDGFFCPGGIESTSEGGLRRHAVPQTCPFDGMVFSSQEMFVQPCLGKLQYECDKDLELRKICTANPSICPCECPRESNSFLLDDSFARGGRVCGCRPGAYCIHQLGLLLLLFSLI